MTVPAMRTRLRQHASPDKAALLSRFFKTGPGEYGEGDRFLGVMVPQIRAAVREFQDAPLTSVRALLASPWHEERLMALLLLVHRYEHGREAERRAVYTLYLRSTDRINNWDLVDLTAPKIVGPHLWERSRKPLYRLARSKSLWERRIAILATAHFIWQRQYDDTLALAELFLTDREDLMHKATGWMLREVAKRDRAVAEAFLRKHCRAMPRTMLRYALERFPSALRRRYMACR